MSLLSFSFLIFLVFVMVIYFAVPKRLQWWVLLAASLVFYGSTGVKNIIYVFITAGTAYFAAVAIDGWAGEQKAWLREHKADKSKEERKQYKARIQKKRQRVFWMAIVLNFGLLCYFKYFNFILEQVGRLASFCGGGQGFQSLDLIVPLGISFYTFQTMGYLTDVYWGKTAAEKSFPRMLLFSSFFPQMTQGPISAYQDLAAELFTPHDFTYHQYSWGLQRMIWGYFKKMVIANIASGYVEDVFANYSGYAGITVFIGMIMYSIQIYTDFSGYMDIVCGFCEVLGIHLTENFNRPYFSKSIAEYWRRWHISLGVWFKAYIYYPMTSVKWNQKFGRFCMHRFGRQIGRTIPASIALIVVWFATGLWHGASWAYIAWGGVNGLFIILSIWMKPVYDKMKEKFHIRENSVCWRGFQVIRTFILVTFIKVLPEVGTLGDGIGVWRQVFVNHRIPTGLRALLPFVHGRFDFLLVAGGTFLVFCTSMIQRKKPVRQWMEERIPYLARIMIYVAALFLIIVFGVNSSNLTGGFLYGQF